MKYNVRVEYECTPIRHIAVQCPKCKKWFYGNDITENDLEYSYQIDMAVYHCPLCNTQFGYNCDNNWNWQDRDKPIIKKVDYPDVYKDCLKQKVIWE